MSVAREPILFVFFCGWVFLGKEETVLRLLLLGIPERKEGKEGEGKGILDEEEREKRKESRMRKRKRETHTWREITERNTQNNVEREKSNILLFFVWGF